MDGRFMERGSGAEYFVRELPDGTIAWVGEHLPRPGGLKAFTNVFLGRRTGPGRAEGDSFDVPKGRANGVHVGVQVTLGTDRIEFRFPDGGVRTLVHPDSDLPSTDAREWGAGFYDEAPGSASFSVTGVWKCNDGGTYYVRQVGDRVVWLGEHPSGRWCNIFFGRLNGRRIAGRWVDVPKGMASGSGDIEVEIGGVEPFARFIDGTRLTRTQVTGGFGGSVWTKTDSLRVNVRLRTLTIVRNADVGGLNRGGDEPYLLPVYITVGGNEYPDPRALLNENSGARPRVSSPLFQHEWGTTGDWPKNNLTWQEDLTPGTVVPIPDFIAYGETELRTLNGLQPNSTLARSTANFVPGIIALEEGSTRNEDIRAGYGALLADAPQEIHRAIVDAIRPALTGLGPSLDGIAAAVTTGLTRSFLAAARASATSDLFGILGGLDPDKSMGASFNPFSLGVLRDAALRGASLPITMTFRGGAGGVWRVDGTIAASLGPARFGEGIGQLEITLETGNDDKRAASNVFVAIRLADGTIRGPFPAHPTRQRFADRSLQVVTVPITPPVLLGNQRELQVGWQREAGDGWLRQPDSWELKRIRVVAFDAQNRRHVLLRLHPVFSIFSGNRTMNINLPPR